MIVRTVELGLLVGMRGPSGAMERQNALTFLPIPKGIFSSTPSFLVIRITNTVRYTAALLYVESCTPESGETRTLISQHQHEEHTKTHNHPHRHRRGNQKRNEKNRRNVLQTTDRLGKRTEVCENSGINRFHVGMTRPLVYRPEKEREG